MNGPDGDNLAQFEKMQEICRGEDGLETVTDDIMRRLIEEAPGQYHDNIVSMIAFHNSNRGNALPFEFYHGLAQEVYKRSSIGMFWLALFYHDRTASLALRVERLETVRQIGPTTRFPERVHAFCTLFGFYYHDPHAIAPFLHAAQTDPDFAEKFQRILDGRLIWMPITTGFPR